MQKPILQDQWGVPALIYGQTLCFVLLYDVIKSQERRVFDFFVHVWMIA